MTSTDEKWKPESGAQTAALQRLITEPHTTLPASLPGNVRFCWPRPPGHAQLIDFTQVLRIKHSSKTVIERVGLWEFLAAETSCVT